MLQDRTCLQGRLPEMNPLGPLPLAVVIEGVHAAARDLCRWRAAVANIYVLCLIDGWLAGVLMMSSPLSPSASVTPGPGGTPWLVPPVGGATCTYPVSNSIYLMGGAVLVSS